MNDADFDIATRTIAGEARGESIEVQTATAHVILNRAAAARAWQERRGKRHPLYGTGDLVSACKQRYQFSCWNEGDPNRAAIEAMTPATMAYRTAYAALLGAAAPGSQDPTRGATHYHTIAKPKAAYLWPPSWAQTLVHTVDVGPHRFYREKD